jgi:hypothetical protein
MVLMIAEFITGDLPMPTDPTDPPQPLDMDAKDVTRVLRHIETTGLDWQDAHLRLSIEILDCLRRIDDKLGKLLTQSTRAKSE